MSGGTIELKVAEVMLEHLDELAADRGMSRTDFANHVLRLGLEETDRVRREYKPFRQKTYNMGARMNLDKAMAIADALYDQEFLRKMQED